MALVRAFVAVYGEFPAHPAADVLAVTRLVELLFIVLMIMMY
jgi:hypothetical protein